MRAGTGDALIRGMRSPLVLYGAIASLILGAGVLTADALVTSDEERLEQLGEDLTERAPDERVGAVLAWTDLSRAAVELSTDEGRVFYEEQDDVRLGDDLAEALAPFADARLEVIQETVRLDGDRATVAVRARDGSAIHDVTFGLARSGQGWLIERVRAH